MSWRMTARGLRAAAQNLLLSLSTVLLVLGTAEAVCRLLEPRSERPTAAYITDWSDWDGEFYTVKSTAAGWPPWEDYNRDGVRDREHSLEKTPGVRRVVCLGDSTTLGWELAPAEAYPQVLQDLLDARGAGFEVFNLALGGWSPRQERIAYERIARKYRPDQILLGICLNDIPEMQNNLARPPAALAALYRRSALARRVWGARAREIRDVEELFTSPDSAGVREAYRRVFREIRDLRDAARADGATLAVLVFPFRLQVGPKAPLPVAQKMLADWCRAEGIPYLDLLPALRGAGEEAFLDYDHFSASGARLVAERVLESGVLASDPAPADGAAASIGAGPLPVATRGVADAPHVLPGLVEQLSDREPATRARAAWTLGTFGIDAHAAVPSLARALEDSEPHVRAGAAWALGRMGALARGAAPALTLRLNDADDHVRWRAGDALHDIGPDTTILEGLTVMLRDPKAPGRAEAARAVGAMGAAAQGAVPALVEALGDPREEVRGRAVWALGEVGGGARGTVPALVQAMRDPAIRWRVADALAGIGAEARGAVPVLTAALEDPNSNVRWRAAKALGRIGAAARPAALALIGALGDSHENVRLGAVHALARIDAAPAAVIPAFLTALTDRDSRVRREAAEALGRIGSGSPPVSAALRKALGDEDEAVRAEAAKALKRLARS